MSDQKSRWLLGCGLGCAAIVVLCFLVAAGGAMLLRNSFKGFETALQTREELDERFGSIDDYTPPPDGAVEPGRVEAFLAVREASDPSRRKFGEAFAGILSNEAKFRDLESKTAMEKLGTVLGITRSAMGLGAEMGRFLEARNRAMLDAGIGMGEYIYIYVTAYYSCLGHEPSDGPRPSSISVDTGDGKIGGAEMGAETYLTQTHGVVLNMLRNQRAALARNGVATAALDAEIAALGADRTRAPWADGVPPAVAAAFEHYRERLEATYRPETNPFELLRMNQRQSGFSIHTPSSD